jgi:hypothetical protein
MRVNAEKQRAAYALELAIITNGLTDGQNMPLIKSVLEGGAAMPRSAKSDPLLLN